MQGNETSAIEVFDELPVLEAMQGHHGKAEIYLGPAHVPGLPFKIAAADAAELVGKPLADLHTHDVDEIYLVVTPGLSFEVETDVGSTAITSPAAVRIPAGVPHRFVVVSTKSSPCPFLGILVSPAGSSTASRGSPRTN